MEALILIGVIFTAMFLIGLIGLIFRKEDKKFYLTLMLIPVVFAVIGFGTCALIISGL
ncbi:MULTISPECIES: hypothetical protein [unclassified Flavobacterium]|jgi:hypothetical protein|uniref:hypothetical protein n=1 Tax=unclassified Flavobacterium TaxID=196869 RepID=UPI002492C980|nr:MULTISPECIES: hypothetical protein [unclassified Flavobacterium]MDQ1166665.1 hypothetical protein [Flavobacterium sp. SORGH_AS_0622]BDU27137.1 hypothetical protein FLGSB24_38810 [Flavobacterium sp. GSB-24]